MNNFYKICKSMFYYNMHNIIMHKLRVSGSKTIYLGVIRSEPLKKLKWQEKEGLEEGRTGG
jgi:hypothetical protein